MPSSAPMGHPGPAIYPVQYGRHNGLGLAPHALKDPRMADHPQQRGEGVVRSLPGLRNYWAGPTCKLIR